MLAREYFRWWPGPLPCVKEALKRFSVLLLDLGLTPRDVWCTLIVFTFSLSSVILRKFLAFSLFREIVGEVLVRKPLGLVLPDVLLEDAPLSDTPVTSSELLERGLLMMVEPGV